MKYKDFALSYVGTREGTKRHKEIIDGYNNGISPLPRHYRVTYHDAWCATFVSYVLLKCGAINAPYECSCYYMVEKAKKNKQIVKTPKVNDLVIYDWGNNGSLDHVGIIYKIVGNNLYVVEGNKSNQVATRVINKDNYQIECFIRVKQKEDTTPAKPSKPATDIDAVARRVINGDYGNYPERKTNLEKEGYDYYTVQKRVNELLS